MLALSSTVALAPTTLIAQAPGWDRSADSVIALIDRGIATGRPDALDPAIEAADRALAATPGDGVMLHYKGYALYRKGSLLVATKAARRDVMAVLKDAEDALAQSANVLRWAETPALRASVAGQLIGVSGRMSAVRLGHRAEGFMEDALRVGPDNPRVLLLRGISAIYKPRMFGGGNRKAEVDLKRAIELFAAEQPASPAPSWGHAEAYAWLGQVYAREKRTGDARAAYQRALDLLPGYGWVLNDLLPALDGAEQ